MVSSYVTGTSKSPASDLLRPSFRPWACQRRPSAWRPSAEQKRGSGQFGFTDIFFSIDLFGYLLKNMTKNPPKSLGFWSRQWNSRENAQVLWLRTTYCKYRSHGNVNEKMYSAFTHLDISKQETYETLFNGRLQRRLARWYLLIPREFRTTRIIVPFLGWTIPPTVKPPTIHVDPCRVSIDL